MRLRWPDELRKVLPNGVKYFASILAIALLFASGWNTSVQAQEQLRTVLILHSYNVDFSWTNNINDGMLETLAASGMPIDLRIEYMDTKFIDTEAYLELLVSKYKLKYGNYPIDVILVSDDNGLRFLLKYREEIFPGVPVVFCGINSFHGELYLQDGLLSHASNITGVVEQVDIEANLELVLKLHPDTQRILMFTDDSVTGQRNFENAQQAVARLNPPIEVLLRNDLTLSQVLALAPDWGPGDVRIEIGTLKNDLGAVITHTESCEFLANAADIPTYGCWTYLLGHGIIGGKVVDGQTQGGTAASMAVQVLHGTPAEAIPIQYSSPNLYLFEYPELARFQVAVRQLPPGSIILHEQQTIFQHYPIQSVVALATGIILLAMIIVLMVSSRLRHQTEQKLAASEERLRLAVQNVPVMLYAYDENGVTIVWNRECEQITGYSAAEIVGNQGAMELVYPDPHIRERLLEMRRKSPGDVQNWEHPVTCKDGTVRTISMTNISAQYPVPGWASWGIGVDVTSRKRVEQQLRESREHFYRLVTLAQEGIVSGDEHENITFANPAFGIALGYEPNELIGRSLLELCDDDSRARVFSGTQQRRRSVVSVYEVSLRTRNGELRDFLLSANPLVDSYGNYEGSLGVFTEITELKLTQEALRRSEESYRQLVESLPDGVLVLVEGCISYLNAAGVEVLGAQQASDLVGKEISALIPPSANQLWQRFAKSILQQERIPPSLEVPLVRLDGVSLDAEIHAARVVVDQQPGIQLIIRDIRERRELLNKLLQQQKDESITTLAGGLAHDFNNILLGIIGAANLLSQSDSLPQEDRDLCEVITTSADRMAELTKNLLSFARGGHLQAQPVQLNQVISNAVMMSRGAVPDNVRVEVDEPDGLWLVQADPTQIEQVLINLIVNAGEAMAGRGGALQIRASNQQRTVAWQCSQHVQHEPGQYVQVTVTDHGTGMDQDTQRRIFDPFFSTKFQGRGLGLAVVNGIVKAHHGCLTVTSNPGQGSEFCLLLPRATVQHSRGVVPPPRMRGGDETILVIDDEEHVLRLINRILSGYGYEVLAALSGSQGLAVFQEQRAKISLVILDRGLQDIAAVQVINELRQATPGLPVVVSSGHAETEALAGWERQQPLAFLHKPYKSSDLVPIVRELLDQAELGQA
jgi:two-component system, cell cycle sensor histidine kinase and response regulator CckA